MVAYSLGWLNTSLDGDHTTVTDGDRWVNAVQGNFDNMPDNPNRHNMYGVIGQILLLVQSLQDYIDGTATSIQGLTKAAGKLELATHGGELTTTLYGQLLTIIVISPLYLNHQHML